MALGDEALVDEILGDSTSQEAPSQEQDVALPKTRPVFQPHDTGLPDRPVFQPHDSVVSDRPVFQPHEAGPTPAQKVATDIANVYAAQTPAIPREEYGVAPRAHTLAELAAQQTAEQYGADFAQRAERAGAVGAALQQAEQYRPVPRAYTRPYLAAAEQAAQFKFQGDKDTLTNLFPKSGNLIEYSDKLSKPVEGVDPATQSEFANNVRGEITKLAQEQFGEKDPDVAYQKALSDPNFGDYVNEFKKQFVGSWAKVLQTVQSATSPDQERLNMALEAMAPGDKAEQAILQEELLKADQRTRGHILQARLPYTANLDYAQLMDGLARLSDPVFQANSRQVVANTREIAKRNLQSDLRLEGTVAGGVVDTLANTPATLFAFNAVPPIAIKQIYDDTREALARSKPELSEGELDTEAAKSTLAQYTGQELANLVFVGGAGRLIPAIKGRVSRAVAQAAINTTGGAAAMGGGQALANIVTGQPITQGMGQALVSGATFGGLGGVIHGAAELARPRAEVTTGRTGARIRGPSERAMEEGAAQAQVAEQPPPAPPAEPVVQRPVTEAEQRVQQKWAEGTEQGGRRFRSDFEDRSNLSQDEALQLLELHSKFENDPSYEMTDAERALVNSVADKTILTDAEKGEIQKGRKTTVADFVRNQRNIVERYSRPTEPVAEPPVQSQEQARQERIVAEPREPELAEADETDLHKATDDLYNRYKTEVALRPIEEVAPPADITKGEPVLPERPGRGEPSEPLRRVGKPVAPAEERVSARPEPVPSDVGLGPPSEPSGREPQARPGVVQPELGRVPGLLESRLSPEERAAFDPEVQALRGASVYGSNHPTFLDAFRALREKIVSRFQDIIDANAIRRRPDNEGSHFSATTDENGNQYLATNLIKGADVIHAGMERYGADPLDQIHSYIQEELIHLANQKVLHNDWVAEGRKGDWGDYQRARARSVLEDLIRAREEARAKGNTRLVNELDSALERSWPVYKARPKDLEDINQVLASESGNQIANRVYELVRQAVQVGSGNPLTESHFRTFWNTAREWLTKVSNHLKALYRRLGPRASLGKTELARMIRATDARIKAMDETARAYREGKRPPPLAPSEGGLAAEAPRPPGARRRTLAEAIKAAKAAYSLAFKGGESAMLDYDETRPLAVALRRKPSEVQRIGAQMRIADLRQAFDTIPRAQRPRVVREFSDYIKAEQGRQPLPAVGADTMRLINAAKDSLEQTGHIMQALNVHVRDGDKIRPARRIGRSYFPRMLSDDTRDIFNNRDTTRAADFNRIVNDAIAKGVVKSRDEFIDKFTHAISGEPGSNGHFANVEKARKLDLPLDFYDFSPESVIRYLTRTNDRLAQISAFGQKIANKGKDIFDSAIEAVNKSGTLSYDAKRKLIARIASEQRAEYQRSDPGPLGQAASLFRTGATGAFLSNWQTSLNNFITGAAQNFVFGGPGTFLKTAARFPHGWARGIAEARDRNILKANLREVLSDYNLASDPGWLSKGVHGVTRFGLKWGGQNLTEDINRVFAMQQAKAILQDFLKDHGTGKTGAMIRSRNDFILRRFGIDNPELLDRLAAERGSGPLSDEFIRQYVLDVHGSYGASQAPAHILDSPTGKVLFQFQHWGANTTRMATREFLMPLARAIQSGHPADIGYQFLRNVGYLSTALGAGVAAQAVIGAVFRRDPRDPSLAEIGKAVMEGRNSDAIQWALRRAWGAFILSGFSGLVGNYADVLQNALGGPQAGRLKDPFHPPSWGLVEPIAAFLQGWAGENGFQGLPSAKLVGNLTSSIASPVRVGLNLYGGVASRIPGLNNGYPAEYAARQDLSFTRNRIKMFEEQYPALIQKREAAGTRQMAIAMAGRTPFDPTRDTIINGLISGNPHQVNDAIRSWLSSRPKTEWADDIKQIKSTISANSPIKVGGSTKPEAVMDFLGWAKNNLPEGEARRIFALTSTYAKTALETNLEEHSEGMKGLARLSYDSFRTPSRTSAKAAVQQRRAQAASEAQVRVLMRAGEAAKALQGG